MRAELQYASRRVFAEFIDAFERHHGQRNWMLSLDPDDHERMGLTYAQVEGAFDLLQNEGLIEPVTLEGSYELTDDGYRACVHRELIDEALGNPATTRGSMLVIQAQQVVVGSNNVLQANSDEVIARLIDHITKSSVPDATKNRLLEGLKDVAAFTIAEGLKLVVEAAAK